MRTKIGWLGLVVVGLVIGSVVSNGAVRADDAPVKKHHHHHVHGKITEVSASSITIMVHHHKKKGSTEAAPAPEPKTFTINDKTKVEIVGVDGSKTTGTVAGLTVGEHVAIVAGENEMVARLIIVGHHHKKKPAA